MAVTATLVDASGDGSLLRAASGPLVHAAKSTLSGRLLYASPVATRFDGVAQLRAYSTTYCHRYASGYLGFPLGNQNSTRQSIQAAADAIYPPPSPAYAYDPRSAAALYARYAIGRNDSTVDFDLPLWMLCLENPVYGYQYIQWLPDAFRFECASIAPSVRYQAISQNTYNDFSGLTLRLRVQAFSPDMSAAYPYLEVLPGVDLANDPASFSLHEASAAKATASAETVALPVQLGAGFALFNCNSEACSIAQSARMLCLQPWFATIPISDGWVGGSVSWAGSMSCTAYLDSCAATVSVFVPGDQRANLSAYAAAYGLS